MSSTNVSKKKNIKSILRPSALVITILLALVLVGGFLGYKELDKLRDENSKLSNPQESAKIETDKVKSEVANILDVPTDEEPTIATVSDVSKLSNQTFFKKAQNGDKLIMYSKAKKAILYRPSTKKVIEVAPINLGDSQETTQSTTQTPKTETATPAQDPAISDQPGISQ